MGSWATIVRMPWSRNHSTRIIGTFSQHFATSNRGCIFQICGHPLLNATDLVLAIGCNKILCSSHTTSRRRRGKSDAVVSRAFARRRKSGGSLPGRIGQSVVTGGVRSMHRSLENAGAFFQVASQFNLLEMVSPEATPEQGVTRAMDTITLKGRLAPLQQGQRPSTEITSFLSWVARARPPGGNSTGSLTLARP